MSEKALEHFLDSVGQLDVKLLAGRTSHYMDSAFAAPVELSRTISTSDFVKLKAAVKEQTIDTNTAKRIFKEVEPDEVEASSGFIYITLYKFDSDSSAFNEFAVCIGSPTISWRSKIYFFHQNKIIGLHDVWHHGDLSMKSFRIDDGSRIVYYKRNLTCGTGIWQYNYNFYRIDDDHMKPVLDVLADGNQQNGWGLRVFRFESAVTNTDPLTIKMTFYQELCDSAGRCIRMVGDSKNVPYHWDDLQRVLKQDYYEEVIDHDRMATFYVDTDELLFIRVFHDVLVKGLGDRQHRPIVLKYLRDTKALMNKTPGRK